MIPAKTPGPTITEINQISTAIPDAIQEQSSATQEIAQNAARAADGTQEVSTKISGVTQNGHG